MRVFVDLRWYATVSGVSLVSVRRRAAKGRIGTEQPFHLGRRSLRLIPADSLPVPVRHKLDQLLFDRGIGPDGTVIVRGNADAPEVVVLNISGEAA